MSVVKRIKNGEGEFFWSWVRSTHKGHQLAIAVMRDALMLSGIRHPATAVELQQIADVLGCMLLTPKVVDLIWIEAGEVGIQFESIVNIGGKIVANCKVEDVSSAVSKRIEQSKFSSGPVEAVGKYWVLSNKLLNGPFGKKQAVNYGWPTKGKGNGKGVLGLHNVWQTIGARHNHYHIDSSQVIRLMYRFGKIQYAGSVVWEDIDLHEVAVSPLLAPLISHEGPLKVLRQPGVEEPEPVIRDNGVVVLPETVIYALPDID